MGMATAPKAPLEIETVTRASEPCGSLFRWLQEVVLEHVERGRAVRELQTAETDLASARARQTLLETEVAKADEMLRAAQKQLADREQDLAQEQAAQAAAHEAAKKLKELEVIMMKPAPPKPKPAPVVTPKEEPVDVEVLSTLAHVQQHISHLRVTFPHGQVAVLDGDPEQAVVMPKIATVLQEHRGKLKLLIEGHRTADEAGGADIERSLAVYQWLVEVAGCPPGMLRIKGREASDGMGSCAVPVPIQELVATCGPICPELVGTAHTRPGLYFADSQATLTPESRTILNKMAKCLIEDEYTAHIEGHADKDESPEIALKRASAVRDALAALGVSKSTLRTKSCKSLHPLSRTRPAVNRRVEIHVE